MDSGELAEWFSRAARDLAAASSVQETVDQACRSCVAVVAGCRSAAISEGARSERGTILAASDPDARALHAVQFGAEGDGPCVEAIWRERMIWCADLAEERRWPGFAAAARERGMRSFLVIRLYTRAASLGALSLYSAEPGAFDEVTRDVAQIFAAHIAFALAGARRSAELARGLTTRQRIGQATGILSERYDVPTEEAFAMLVRASQDHNLRLRDLADQLVTRQDAARPGRRQRP